MSRKIATAFTPLFFLSSCLQGEGGGSASFSEEQRDGLTQVFDAFCLSKSPIKEEREVKILGHSFLYYNVYAEGEGGFVLQDDTSYMRNYDLYFGLSFSKGLGRAYDISGGKEGYDLCEDCQESEMQQSHSVYGGFEIAIDKTLSFHHYDESIGKIVHWC